MIGMFDMAMRQQMQQMTERQENFERMVQCGTVLLKQKYEFMFPAAAR